MGKFTAEDWYAMADQLESKIGKPDNTDDPRWTRRRVKRMRQIAQKKEKAAEHKENQK